MRAGVDVVRRGRRKDVWTCPPILDGDSAGSEQRMTYNNRPDFTAS